PTQMHQVFMNLCTNSAHAMRETGGTLGIEVKNVEIRQGEAPLAHLSLTPGTYLKLSISDTGHGMSPEVMERIFEPYFTTKDKGEGTGLGLAMVHGIAKDHGGTINVYSEPEKGSIFHVYLPVIEKEEEEVREPAIRLPRGNERILLVDDEAMLVEVGSQMLELLGYRVTTRTSSVEALELFRTRPEEFDLVITDMTMPQMSGDILARELRKIRPSIPVIICTGFSERISPDRARLMGIQGFAMKPLVIKDLAGIVREVLDKRKFNS
ncbi:sensory box histidine kinase/response regulator protein, partial [Methanosarcinales archaeon]